MGNRTNKKEYLYGLTGPVNSDINYTYNEFNQLTRKRGGNEDADYTYDARGNQIQEIVNDYYVFRHTYDLRNQLYTTAELYGNEQKHDQKNYYNASGQRIEQAVDTNEVTKYYYMGSAVLYTTAGGGLSTTENVLSPDGNVIASKRFQNAEAQYRNKYFFYHTDIRGAVLPAQQRQVYFAGQLYRQPI